MKLFCTVAFVSILGSSVVFGQAPSASSAMAAPKSTTLKVGDMAPDFTLPATTGDKVKLSSFRGKQAVVLAFFPAAFTGGCTKEMQTYQLGIEKFKKTNAAIYGVSTDNTPSQKEFANKLTLAFPLLSDFADRNVSKEYGVFLPQMGVANRVTFVVDKAGKISYMEGGKDAIAILGAGDACSRLSHRTTGTK